MKNCFLFLSLLIFSAESLSRQLIFIDPGHTLESPGATGTCGTPEVWVNDLLSLKLARILQQSGYRVEFSRLPNLDRDLISSSSGREPGASLRARAEKANRLKADLFISIHHDSAYEKELVYDAHACSSGAQGDGRIISPDFEKKYDVQIGFNVFFHRSQRLRTKMQRSFRFANFLGENMVKAGEVPATYHVRSVEPNCTSCRWENKPLGVMSRNYAILRRTRMPSVLFEVTNLRVPGMEKNANSPDYQLKIARILKESIDQYFGKSL